MKCRLPGLASRDSYSEPGQGPSSLPVSEHPDHGASPQSAPRDANVHALLIASGRQAGEQIHRNKLSYETPFFPPRDTLP